MLELTGQTVQPRVEIRDNRVDRAAPALRLEIVDCHWKALARTSHFDFMVFDSWLWLPSLGFLALGSRLWVPGLGFLALDSWPRIPGFGFLVLHIANAADEVRKVQ